MILSRAGLGHTKPPPGTRINWGHPLANGLAHAVQDWPSVRGAIELTGSPGGVTGASAPAGGPRASLGGVGIEYTGGGSGWGPTIDRFSGLASATFASSFLFGTSVPSTNENLGFAQWSVPSNLIIRAENATQARCIINLTTTDADLIVTHGFGVGRVHTLVWRLAASILTAYVDGRPVSGSSTGSGTITWTVTTQGDFVAAFAAHGGSINNLGANNVGLWARAWTRALSPEEIRWLHVEPYAFLLRQSPSVKYFLPQGAVVRLLAMTGVGE